MSGSGMDSKRSAVVRAGDPTSRSALGSVDPVLGKALGLLSGEDLRRLTRLRKDTTGAGEQDEK